MHRWLFCVVLAAAVILPAWYWRGGVLEGEATSFLVNYTDDRGWVRRIFDPARNDFDAYQSRELSYVIDAIDANAGRWIIGHLRPDWLIPVSNVIAAAGLAVLLFAVLSRWPGLGALNAALLTLTFVTSFQFVSTVGIWYRSSKLWLTLMLLLTVRELCRDQRIRPARLFLLCLAASLLDRQGFFLAGVLLAVALGIRLWLADRTIPVAPIVAALAGAVIYNLVIAPVVIHAANGYWPDFAYQARALRPSWLWPHLLRAAMLLADTVMEWLGGTPLLALPAVGAVAVLLVADGAWIARQWLTFAIAGGAQLILLALMIRQHPPIDEFIDHRFWNYTLPVLTLAAIGAGAALDAVGRQRAIGRVVTIALIGIVCANLFSLRTDWLRIANGPYFAPLYEQSERLKTALRTHDPSQLTDEGYRAAFDRLNRTP